MINIPRVHRIWYPGATYHVINRGNHKDIIFRETEDYRTFLKFISITQEKYPFQLISFCLMSNHVHLQIQTIDYSLSNIMHHLSLSYSKYFNYKYNLVGHLFQNRYIAEIIEDLPYLLQTSRYIHLNPVKANIVTNPIEYFWSSYGAFMGKRKNDLLSCSKILDHFNDDVRLYQKYVENNVHVEDMSDIIKRYEMKM